MSATCNVVELDLAAPDFPDRLSWLALLSRLPELGTLRCVEVAVRPSGGGRLSFVVLEGPAIDALRDTLRALVGDAALVRCMARPS
jgi:hypothetical protein